MMLSEWDVFFWIWEIFGLLAICAVVEEIIRKWMAKDGRNFHNRTPQANRQNIKILRLLKVLGRIGVTQKQRYNVQRFLQKLFM